MAGINVGSVLVDVLPDARGWDARLQEQIRNITAKVKIELDDSGTGIKIDAIKAKLAELGAKSPNIKVDVDTAGAQAKLAAVGAEADRTADKTKRAGSSASGASGGMSALMQAAIGLSPALVPVGAAALGAAAALATLGAAGVAGAGVLTIALTGVTKAVGLLGQQQKAQQAAAAAAGTSAASNAQAIVSAQRQIVSAEMSLGDARRAAANAAVSSSQQVASAQYGLIQADRQERDALVALQSAREAATRQLTSMANSAVDARLAEQQAVLDLQTAITNNSTAQASSTATEQQKAQAALDLQKAQQHLTEAQQASTYAQQDNAKAQKLGVDGAPQVVSAAQNVATAQHNQAQAAQTSANAQRAQADQQIQSAESIRRAQQGVAAAMDQLAAADRKSAGSTSASLAAINAQVSALDPATRKFAEYLRGTWGPTWRQVQAASAGGLLPGLQAGMDAMRSSMPQFLAFIRDISARLGDMASVAGKALSGPFWQGFFAFVSRTAGPALSALGAILGNVARGFAGLWMAFEPIILPMIDGVVTLSKRFADFGEQASTSSGFGKFIDYVKQALPLVGDIVKNLLKAVGEAVAALAPVGIVILRVLDGVAKFLAGKLIPFLAPIVRFIVNELAPVIGRILRKAIDGAHKAFGDIMDAINGNRPQLHQLWDFIKNYLAPVIGTVLWLAFRVVGGVISEVITDIGKLVSAWNWLWGIGKGIGHWFANDFVHFFVGAWRTISSGWDGLVKGIAKLWGNLKHYLMDPVAFIVRYVIDDGLIKAWNWVVGTLHLPGSWHANPMAVPGVPPLMAHGGVIPGYAPGVDSVHAILSPGEGVLVPEAVRGLGGPAAIHAINSQFNTRAGGPRMSGGLAHFDGGGFWSGLANIASDLIPGMAAAKSVSPQLNALMNDPLHAFSDLVKSLMGGLSSAAPMAGMLGDLIGSLAKGAGQAIWNALGSGLGGNASAPAGASVERWRSLVDTVLRLLGQSTALDNGVLALISHESGGNPNAINLTDSNAAAGHPSQGLMQTIPSTFYAYAGPYASLGIMNPMANIYAGVAYALQNYGPGMLAAGGRHNSSGQYIGYDNGGALDPGHHLVYNGTGQTEVVAPRQNFEQMVQAMTSGRSGGAASPDTRAAFHVETMIVPDSQHPAETAAALAFMARTR